MRRDFTVANAIIKQLPFNEHLLSVGLGARHYPLSIIPCLHENIPFCR